MMTSQQQLIGWLTVFFIVILGCALGIRIRDHLRKRKRPDPLAPEAYPEFKAEIFSLRRMK